MITENKNRTVRKICHKTEIRQKTFGEWLQQHPVKRVNQSLRILLTHYINFYPEDQVPGLSKIVLDITSLMELLDAGEESCNTP